MEQPTKEVKPGRFSLFVDMVFTKLLDAMQLIVKVGRKLTAAVVTEALLATLGAMQISILHTEPTLCYWMMAGVAGFFFGFNILGDHIFGGKNEGKPSCK